MDINALGTQYSNSAYVPLSSAPIAAGHQAGETGAFEKLAFEKLLKRTQDAQGSPDITLPPASKKTPVDKNDKLYELCMDLETFMIKNLLKSMRSTIQKSKFIDTGFAGEMYEDMLYDEYAKTFAKNAGLGFAEMAYRELSGYR